MIHKYMKIFLFLALIENNFAGVSTLETKKLFTAIYVYF